MLFIQWRGFYFNNGTSTISGLIQYPISFNTVYYIYTTNHSSEKISDTGGADLVTTAFSNSPKVTDKNSCVWISNPKETRYMDIAAIGI